MMAVDLMTTNTILIADESRLQGTILQRLLEKHGFKVHLTENSEQVLDVLSKEKIELIFADYSILSSVEDTWWESIRCSEDHSDLIVIAVCSSDDIPKIEVISPKGPNHYLVRPYQENQVITLLKQLLKQNSQEFISENHPNQESMRIAELLNNFKVALEHNQTHLETKRHYHNRINHDIRTPMNAILGFTHLIRQKKNNGDITNYLDHIEKSGKRLLTAFEHSIREESHSEEVARSICESIKKRLITHSPKLKHEVLFDIEQDANELDGPIRMIEEALFNVIEFAQQKPNEGPISVAIKVDDSSDHKFKHMVFAVKYQRAENSNDGVNSLFDSNTQPLSNLNSASDIGLTLARMIVESLSGKVKSESSDDMDTLSFYIPFKDFHTHKIKKSELPKIMLVDDEPISRRLTASLLEKHGMELVLLGDGQAAVEFMSNSTVQVDLILMDLLMPKMNGNDATKKIRQFEHCKNIPIIGLSANYDDETRKACLDAGMTDYLTKSSDPTNLYSTVSEWLPSLTSILVTEKKSILKNVEEDSNLFRLELKSAFPMLNVQSASRISGEDQKYLMSLLSDFRHRYLNFYEQFNTHLEDSDLASARRLVHSIKGTAATLGLEQIANQASVIESIIIHTNLEDIPNAIELLSQQINIFSDACERWHSQNTTSQNVSELQLNQVLEELTNYLENDDPLALDYFESHRKVIHKESSDLEKILSMYIKRYDLCKALTELNKYRISQQKMGASNG